MTFPSDDAGTTDQAHRGALTTTADPTTTVRVRYFAAARAAAGVDDETITLSAPATVATLWVALADRHGAQMSTVLERCSVLLDEVVVRDHTIPLGDGALLDVLPPFAGG